MIYYYSKQKRLPFKESNSNIKFISNLQTVVDTLSKEKELSLDCETTGLDPLKHKIIMLQVGTLKDQYVIDTRGTDLSLFKPLLEDKSILYIGHNLKFDYNMLKRHDIVLNSIYDTMLADMVIYNGKYNMEAIKRLKRFSLKSVYYHHFKKNLNKEIREEFQTWGKKPFTLEHITYGAKDIIYPLEIKQVQDVWADRYKLKKAITLENRASLALGDIEYNGFKIDTDKWLKVYKKYKLKIVDTEKLLDSILIAKDEKYKLNAIQLDLFSGMPSSDKTSKVNWSSDQQVLSILTSTFNIYPTDKDNKLSSSTKALELLDEETKNLPIVKTLMQYRKEDKIISTFGEKYLSKYLGIDGRLHTTFNSVVETGRVSSRNPNLQQVPSDKEFRSCFIAEEGNLLSTADYASQEARAMADMANDQAYIDFFLSGDGDSHSFVATRMFSAAFNKEFIVTKNNENKAYRQKGKILNFFVSFGGSAFTLSKTLKITVKEAQELIDAFFKGFPALRIFFDNNAKFALNHGYIRTNPVTNRIRWMPEFREYQKLKALPYRSRTKEENSRLGSLGGRIRRKALNTPIQGSSGDMTKTALVLIREKLLSLNIRPTKDADIKLVSVVHDETSVEATKDKIGLAAKIQQECMEKAGTYYCKKIPMAAEAEVGLYWIH